MNASSSSSSYKVNCYLRFYPSVPEFGEADGGIRQRRVSPLCLRLAEGGQSHSNRVLWRVQVAGVQRGRHRRGNFYSNLLCCQQSRDFFIGRSFSEPSDRVPLEQHSAVRLGRRGCYVLLPISEAEQIATMGQNLLKSRELGMLLNFIMITMTMNEND